MSSDKDKHTFPLTLCSDSFFLHIDSVKTFSMFEKKEVKQLLSAYEVFFDILPNVTVRLNLMITAWLQNNTHVMMNRPSVPELKEPWHLEKAPPGSPLNVCTQNTSKTLFFCTSSLRQPHVQAVI